MVVCTASTQRDLPGALLLARDVLRRHPTARFSLTLVDPPTGGIAIDEPGVELLAVHDLDVGPARWQHLVTMFTGDELAAAVKPFLLRQLLGDAACVLYLAPWIKLYADLDPLVTSTVAHGISLTPHRRAPVPLDGASPSEGQLLAWGTCNLDYLGVATAARPFLDWWAERLFLDEVHTDPGDLTAHQRWIDLALPVFEPHLERSPACNLAHWNVDAVELHQRPEGPYVGDEPLRFFNFAGFDPATPWRLSTRTTGRPRVRLSEHPVLERMCLERSEELRGEGAGRPAGATRWGTTNEGVELRPLLRAFVRAEVIRARSTDGELPPTPFDDDRGAAFARLLTDTTDVPWDLPLVVYLAWCEQPDLQATFGDPGDATTRTALLDWVRATGVTTFDGWASLGLATYEDQQRRVPRASSTSGGVDVLGYLTAEVGVGEAARRLVTGLRAGGVAVSAIDCDLTPCRRNHAFPTEDRLVHDTLVIAANADALGPVIGHLGPDLLPRRVIGQWFWEVERFPPSLAPAIDVLDEVWVPTEHIAAALRPLAGERVAVVPIPLTMDEPRLARLSALPVATGPFTFLFMFDFHSVFERKNPVGAIEAFRLAFDDGEGPRLIIKSMNGQHWPSQLEHLRWAARGRSDIEIIDGYLDPEEVDRLMWTSDCYVSLHRAEGLGLTLAEAMNMGKPVIATGYSGNVSFMSADTAHLLPYVLEETGPGHGPYPPEGLWAAPDLQAAAAAMRGVVDDVDAANALGRAGRDHLAVHFSPEATGPAMRRRLELTQGS